MLKKVDFTNRIDDITPIRNPHKGWYWHYVDNGLGRPVYRDKGFEHIGEFPCLNHLYLRLDWSDIEKEEGVMDWSVVDEIMDRWSGYTFSLRICCAEGEDIPFATPKWLYDMGCKGAMYPPEYEENREWWDTFFGGKEKAAGRKKHLFFEPDYRDTLFLRYLERFIAALSEKYDGDSRIEFVDIGSIGMWGEGHTWLGSCLMYGAECIKKHVALYVKYFKETPVLINDDLIWETCLPGEEVRFMNYKSKPENLASCAEIRRDFLDFCLSLGLGIRDDSALVYDPHPAHISTLRHQEWFDLFRDRAPVDIEFQHYHAIHEESRRGGLGFIDALEAAHATYAGFHTWPDLFLKENRWLAEYLGNRLGYWYFLNSVVYYDVAVRGAKIHIEMEWENKGFAPCYYLYQLDFIIEGEGQCCTVTSHGFDNRRFAPGEKVKQLVYLSVPEEAATGKNNIYFRITDSGRIVYPALKKENEDGSYFIGEIIIL